MKYLTGNEIREKFLDFFEKRGHLRLPSASLIPQDDPTLLLIGAGMAPFKPFFTGKMKPPSLRVTTCQKCVRTGDIENVGRTARHHTYFEMLGNFSFGDYFKQDVIPWSWEFITKELAIPGEKLWITIHTEDDEAYDIWHNVVGVPDERIVRLEENFWEIGIGPCGPCSEIHVDLGKERGCGRPECTVGCDCDRFFEIWNLVFTQYNQNDDGTYSPLKSKNIDTGAGLERLASVIQEKPSNFETDLIFPIIEYAANVAGVEYGKDKKIDVSLKVIADHARSITFMIGDGILPLNEGRGYILRRVLRRAVRHGRIIGINGMFLAGAVDVVIKMFGHIYTNLTEKRTYIQKVIEIEETSFLRTLKQGSELLKDEIWKLEAENTTVLNGATAFKLSDTFGFPMELTEEILAEQGMTVDKDGFEKALAVQRKMAREARDDKAGRPVIYNTRGLDIAALKVDEKTKKGTILKLYPAQDAQSVETMADGCDVAIISDITAFHAEGGGQIGDIGRIIAPLGVINITGTRKLPDGATIMLGTVMDGTVSAGENIVFEIDAKRKMDIARNHTATHLLHAALKRVLGEHVNQAGSYVGPDRLRFDFSHFSQMMDDEIKQVETLVNDEILAGINVEIEELPIVEAKKCGAMALFGEKYGSIVRVVTIPSFSMELCGGSHVNNTAQIGMFKIIAEGSTGAGVRRIEAVTGHGAILHVNETEDMIRKLAISLKCRINDLPIRLEMLQSEYKSTLKKVAELTGELAAGQASDAAGNIREINDVSVLVQKVTAENPEALRSLGDKMRDKTGGVVVLASIFNNEKISILAMATKEAVEKGVHAGNIVKAISAICGGRGGGRPDMAQAGGKDTAKLDTALGAAWDIIEDQIN
ncbi:MAG: alanine--tRNA ligase [Phascolarctobacterium sp.]|nr:alanine--tRNA ligase [Phascolarctobacterium sp.]